MQGAVTFEFVAVVAAVVTFIAGVWWRVEGRIEKAKGEAVKAVEDEHKAVQAVSAQANLALTQIADLKVHAAETYVTKAGLREMKDEMLEAIRDVKGSVDHLNARLDTALISRQGNGQRRGG